MTGNGVDQDVVALGTELGEEAGVSDVVVDTAWALLGQAAWTGPRAAEAIRPGMAGLCAPKLDAENRAGLVKAAPELAAPVGQERADGMPAR